MIYSVRHHPNPLTTKPHFSAVRLSLRNLLLHRIGAKREVFPAPSASRPVTSLERGGGNRRHGHRACIHHEKRDVRDGRNRARHMAHNAACASAAAQPAPYRGSNISRCRSYGLPQPGLLLL